MVRTLAPQVKNAGSSPVSVINMAPSSKWLGHSSFTAAMTGSSPAGASNNINHCGFTYNRIKIYLRLSESRCVVR